ncbi:hypothetical protein OK015_08600 [Mycobacterium sp. Aquia_216]|uniref:hypothetical protein n=1 Tax=Mycobacterium sp. Aquia_216 TaxID=2991729 RepID=UPI00227B9B8E|nr:hypothetical protein [Mycobacterium sp. Aquia_216]WAJ46505.1 hypothetical protein OK015_08600 [Mycobacterium sp. Aquia_216]
MGSHEGGRWDIEIENNAVHVERISDSDEQVFEDFLSSEEARNLAGLLTKFADKLDESEGSDSSDDESDDSDEKSDDSDDESDDSDEKSKKSDESDKSDKSDNA